MIETGLKHSSELTVTENVTAMVIAARRLYYCWWPYRIVTPQTIKDW